MRKILIIILSIYIFTGCSNNQNTRINSSRIKKKKNNSVGLTVNKVKKNKKPVSPNALSYNLTDRQRLGLFENRRNNQSTTNRNTGNSRQNSANSQNNSSGNSQNNNTRNYINNILNQNNINNGNTQNRENERNVEQQSNGNEEQNANANENQVNKIKVKTFKTKYITYFIGKRVRYKTRYKWIRRRTGRTEKKLGLEKGSLIPFKMGQSLVFVEQFIKGKADITYFFVHPNESTAYIGLKKHIMKYGGRGFLFIGTGKYLTRRIRYLIYKVRRFPFALDPNRIYTDHRTIRREFLKVGYTRRFWANNIWYWRSYKKLIKNAVFQMSGFYKVLADVSPDPIVAVHDNPGTLYWAKDIFIGRNRYRIAKRWYKKRSSWFADFFYVIRYKDYRYFRKKGLNVILQNNRTVPNDGSMSVYFAKKSRWYMCIEIGRVGVSKRVYMALRYLKAIRKYILLIKKRERERISRYRDRISG